MVIIKIDINVFFFTQCTKCNFTHNYNKNNTKPCNQLSLHYQYPFQILFYKLWKKSALHR